MVGIIQEQHPDRARLFMQWKQMGWPIMIDALNELEVAVVPITMFIDQHGIIRALRPPRRRITEAVQRFVDRRFDDPAQPATRPDPPIDSPIGSPTNLPSAPPTAPSKAPDLARLRAAAHDGASCDWRTLGQALVNWGGSGAIDEAITAFETALGLEPEAKSGPTSFRLGVAYRRRYDSAPRRPEDFQQAVDHWSRALDSNPNQYIWRRRIQQYGPRLAKPYPFYDWVEQARVQIRARGETPYELAVEPGAAELARPQRRFSNASDEASEPDPQRRIDSDRRGFILAETVVVPAAVKAGSAVRVHLIFRPNDAIDAHWNNEAEPMQMWVAHPPGWLIDRHLHTIPNADTAVSRETRAIEFELGVPADAPAGTIMVGAYALYNVCEGVDGTCLYRRQEIRIPVKIGGS